MNRRRSMLLASVAGLALGNRVAAQPKPVDRTIRVAIVLSTSPVAEMLGPEPAHPVPRYLLQELRKLGYVEGRNLVLERRSAEGRPERHEPILAELVALKCDVIVVITAAIARAAKKVTATVPIVFAIAGGGSDPVAAGLVQSLARPGGNITGVVPDAGAEIYGKRVELLKQVAPAVRRVAYLGLAQEWDSPSGRSARAAAKSLGIELFHVVVDPNRYAAALDSVLHGRADAILASSHPVHYAHRADIIAFASRNRLPAMHAFFLEGGLIAYAQEGTWSWMRVADIIDRIVKGTPPAEIPVERPTRFELLINLRTAKALGLTIPKDVLLRADRVIE